MLHVAIMHPIQCCQPCQHYLLHLPWLVCSYPFEIHDDALVLKKMLEQENMQHMVAQAAAAQDGK